MTPPAPLLPDVNVTVHYEAACCPGRPLTPAGNRPQLRRGVYREPEPPGPRRDWFGLTMPLTEAQLVERAERATGAVAVSGPRVPARYAAADDEIAKQAGPLGHAAADLGWRVDPWFYVERDGTRVSLLLLSRGELRAYAAWEALPGGPWKTAGAYAWRVGELPVSTGVKRLRTLIDETGSA